MRLRDDRVIAPSAAERRRAASCLYRAGTAHGLLVFRVADTHVHALVATSAERARAFARALATRLHLGVPFEPARVRPIVDQQHLYRAARYVLRQEQHHGIDVDPLHDGSSLPDLVGARVLGAATARLLRERLPRFDPSDLLPPSSDAALDLRDLPDAAAAAFGLADPQGRTPPAVHERRAGVQVARQSAGSADVALVLGISERTARRFLQQPCPPHHLRAVVVQARWRAGLRDARRLQEVGCVGRAGAGGGDAVRARGAGW